MREAEREEANDEEVKANREMLTKSRLLKLLIKKQYVKLREVTEEEQPADLAELLEELDEKDVYKRQPSTGTPTLTRPKRSPAFCPAVSRTCWSTAVRASPLVWPPTSRPTT